MRGFSLTCGLAVATCAALLEANAQDAIRPLADDYVCVYESPDAATVYCYTPGITRLPGGRLVATFDLGGDGAAALPGSRHAGDSRIWRGRIYTSDDGGRTWTRRGEFPFVHARPFLAGKWLYVLGQSGDLMAMRSGDGGETWSEPTELTEGQHWHQSACNVWRKDGAVYLVMERRVKQDIDAWNVAGMAPVLMRGREQDDLTRRENWTFASELAFNDAVDYRKIEYLGVPFFKMEAKKRTYPAPRRSMAPIGWLETNVVQFTDPDHVWYDPTGRTFYLWARAHTGGTNLAAIAKVVENQDGSMTTSLAEAPSGEKMVFVPCPGGQMRFHILFDQTTKLFWLLSSQSTDSMTRPDRLPADRYSLPNNERHRLVLHFSRNCVDWCFAGVVALGKTPGQGRHYASMVIDGDDLHILSRSGDHRAKNAHDGNLITFHTVHDFRRLVY